MEFLSCCNVDMAYQEMHLLAYVYHWDRNSIWNIPLKERKRWVRLILEQNEKEKEAFEN